MSEISTHYWCGGCKGRISSLDIGEKEVWWLDWEIEYCTLCGSTEVERLDDAGDDG